MSYVGFSSSRFMHLDQNKGKLGFHLNMHMFPLNLLSNEVSETSEMSPMSTRFGPAEFVLQARYKLLFSNHATGWIFHSKVLRQKAGHWRAVNLQPVSVSPPDCSITRRRLTPPFIITTTHLLLLSVLNLSHTSHIQCLQLARSALTTLVVRLTFTQMRLPKVKTNSAQGSN